jgi:hypothetical protein
MFKITNYVELKWLSCNHNISRGPSVTMTPQNPGLEREKGKPRITSFAGLDS